MIKELLNYLNDKKILILGVGLEGKSTYDFLRRNFPEKNLYIADKSTNLLERYPEFMEDMNLEISMGEQYLNGIDEYDIIIKSPGISFKDIDIARFESKISSQLQLLLQFVKCFTIGVTGTKGKSTTSSLIYSVLKDQNKEAFLIGNIGKPIFDIIENLTPESNIVLELSSHALQYVTKSPNIAILLNVYQEHLDYYKSFDEYKNSKFNITKFQAKEDVCIYNQDNLYMKNYPYKDVDYGVTLQENANSKNHVKIVDDEIYCNNQKVININVDLKLKGIHNINNIMFVIAVSDILGLELEKTIETIKEFEPLEHRMEFVGKIDSVEYYNDSIATIPEATINTIKALKNVNTLIVGGKDRGVDLQEFIDFLQNSNVENIICLPKTGEYIYEGLKNANKNLHMVANMEEAVKIAKKVTPKDTICVLSPAASSYGYFKNFQERGNIFKKLVTQDDIKKTDIKN